MLYHIRPYRVELDVTHQCQQVAFAIHDRRPVASLPQGTAAAVGSIEILHVTPTHGLEDLADAVVELGCGQKMEMVGHPDIGVDCQTVLVCRFDQDVAEELKVGFGGKDHLSVVAPLDNVLRLTGNHVSREAGHGSSVF